VGDLVRTVCQGNAFARPLGQTRRRHVVVNQTDDAGAIAKWWAPRQLTNLAAYRDEAGKLGFDFETGVLPTTVLYDAEGKEVWRIVGGMDWDGARANMLLADVLG
jgi:hypothetical protein